MSAVKLLQTSGLDTWVQRLSQEELPMFAHTARQIAALSASSSSSVADMNQAILNDGSLTARVLRLANSAFYNPSGEPIKTVSRAIVLLGFDVVRNIALSIKILDTVLRGVCHERAMHELVRMFHAAFQAKHLVGVLGGNRATEELFISAMLHRLGHLTFWCFPYGYDDALDFEYALQEDEQAAENAMLGFTLDQLTEYLTRHWGLDHLLSLPEECCDDEEMKRLSLALKMGCQIAKWSEKGWERKGIQQCFETLVANSDLPLTEIKKTVFQTTQYALQAVAKMGVDTSQVSLVLPPHFQNMCEPQSASQKTDSMSFRLTVLRDLAHMLTEKVNLNAVLGAVLEGAYRSLPMDRVVFAWVKPGSNILEAKYVLGRHRKLLMERFKFELCGRQENLFGYILKEMRPEWFDRRKRFQLQTLITPAVQRCVGHHDFFAMPIYLNGQAKGMVFADRCVSGEALTQADFQFFYHLCEHVSIALKLLPNE